MTYTKKFATVQASQFNGDRDDLPIEQIMNMSHVLHGQSDNKHLHILTIHETLSMSIGDWLLVDGEDMKVLSDTEFKRQYK